MRKRRSYLDCKSHAKLLELSRNPYDLTVDDVLLEDNRIENYRTINTYFTLQYWAQRVDDTVLDTLQKLADECNIVEQFVEMKRGGLMNTIEGVESEDRQVLHTACRDLFGELPHHQEATDLAGRELLKLRDFLEEVESGVVTNGKGEKFTSLIHVGIGGSDLGPRSVYEALKPFGLHGRKVHFISNVDPDDAAAQLTKGRLETSLVCIVSKSGTTLETLTNEELVRQAFVKAGLNPSDHFVAVTGQGSPMDNPQRYLRSFYMYDYIGGRYSSTSMVGLVSLGFYLGFEQINAFLKGAYVIDYESEQKNIRKNPALLLALLGVWNHSYLNLSTVAVLPYSQGLHRFPAHLQQCDMESNGKSVDRLGQAVNYATGPIVWGEPGTNGQHAFYQLLHQGREIVPCEFIGFRKSQYGQEIQIEGTSSQQKLVANLLAQSLALATGQKSDNPNKTFSGNRPNSILLAERLTPEVMGALLALYETKIVMQGFLWNINSFDQEGVQLGKVLANRFLGEMSGLSQKQDSLTIRVLNNAGMV